MLEKPDIAYNSKMLNQILKFLSDIDIQVKEAELNHPCFLPGLDIKEDCILLDRKRLKYPGDLLHEAGHLAVTKEELRLLIGTKDMDPDWPCAGDEIAAIHWPYAALSHLKIAPEVVFHAGGYKNESDWIIEQFNNGIYFGLPILVWMGFCHSPENSKDENAILFPKMIKWLR